MTRKSTYVAAVLVCSLFFSVTAFSQSVNATVGGAVSDASGALIPGVTVIATNVGTNIANTTVSNESGAYNFPALQPGTYKVSAELPGFQTQTFTDVQLGGAQQVKLNFTLQVAAAAGTNVEVTVAADTILATTAYGQGIAADTGSAIAGARIDLWFSTEADALAWGRRSVTVALGG